jgi:hypothetical protein
LSAGAASGEGGSPRSGRRRTTPPESATLFPTFTSLRSCSSAKAVPPERRQPRRRTSLLLPVTLRASAGPSARWLRRENEDTMFAASVDWMRSLL